eukprot:scaffold72126_cov71-Phaeocystis_antarctica.AAC.2
MHRPGAEAIVRFRVVRRARVRHCAAAPPTVRRNGRPSSSYHNPCRHACTRLVGVRVGARARV